MARRPKKGEPEMLLVSFCDIVTVVTAVLFMAVIITVQESTKVPIYRPTPMSKPTNKTAVLFECRNNEIFPVDKENLDKKIANSLSSPLLTGISGNNNEQAQQSMMIKLMELIIEDEYYRVMTSFLPAGIVAIQPKRDAHGDDLKKLENRSGKFEEIIRRLKPNDQYVTFLVREDSWDAFHLARKLADSYEFDVGWEFMTVDEPIKFGVGGVQVGTQ